MDIWDETIKQEKLDQLDKELEEKKLRSDEGKPIIKCPTCGGAAPCPCTIVMETFRDKWEDTAYDLLQAIGFAEGRQDMTQEEVIDVVADMVIGSMCNYTGQQREALEWFAKLPLDSELRDRICKTAFPFSHYGY